MEGSRSHRRRRTLSLDQQDWSGLGTGMTPKVLWEVVRVAATRAGIEKLARHDLRRSCARLCHLAGGELDQIQFLLGHVSIQTTDATSAASRNCASPSTTEWALNRIMRWLRS